MSVPLPTSFFVKLSGCCLVVSYSCVVGLSPPFLALFLNGARTLSHCLVEFSDRWMHGGGYGQNRLLQRVSGTLVMLLLY